MCAINVGLLPQGGNDWIAGVIYLENLIFSLSLTSEYPKIYYFVPNSNNYNNSYLNKNYFSDNFYLKYYTYSNNLPFREKIKLSLDTLKQLRWPHSLEQLIINSKVDVIYPTQQSLGKKFPVPWIGWIPDFQHKKLPDFFTSSDIIYRDLAYQKLIEESSHMVVTSDDAYQDLMTYFPTQPNRVSVLPFTSVAQLQWYQDNPEEVAISLGLPTKYLMFPSQFWRHKNHLMLFRSMKILIDKGITNIALVLTGNTSDYRWPDYFSKLQQYIKENELERYIHILGLIERQQQIQLMRQAVAIVQPSLCEGWSSLVEDARTLGKRIYLSDIPIHKEQNPPDAIYFNPNDPEELAEVVAQDWQYLTPERDKEKEHQASVHNHQRALEYGKAFLKIAQQVSLK